MYKSKLFTILILTLLLPMTLAFSPSYMATIYNNGSDSSAEPGDAFDTEVPTSPEGYKKFNEFMDDLNFQIARIHDVRARVDYLHSRLDEIEKERSHWNHGRVQDEISMDLIVGVLREVPKGDYFEVKNCDQYRRRIFINFDPTVSSKDEPREPSVNRAFQVFKKICDGKSVEI